MAVGVFVDANVLFSRTLRDWLFLLRNETDGGMFTVCTSEDVIAETLYHLRREHPKAPGRLISGVHDRIVVQLDDRVSDYEIDGSFPGNDSNDAHIHAAAIASGAGVVLSADHDFTGLAQGVLDSLPYEVHTPDSFFALVDDSSARAVRRVIVKQLDYWFARDGEVDLGQRLSSAQCPEFSRRVATHLQTLEWRPAQ